MHHSIKSLAALALVSFSSLAAAHGHFKQEAIAIRDAAQADLTGYHLVRDLTTEVGARMPGTEADKRAVDWMVERFNELGFDKVWTEPVTFPNWVRGAEKAWINAPFKQDLHITALGGSVGTEGPVSAEVVMFADLEALKKANPAEVRGKIVYIAKRMFSHIEGAGYGDAVIARAQGAAVAEEKGAVAFLLRSIGTDSHRFPHTGMMSVRPTIAAAALSNPDADQMERLLAKHNISVTVDVNAGFKGEYTSHNVIADIVGSEFPEEIILIGGHLDSWDLGTGAIDDGAGVGITTGAAVQFLKKGQRPKRTIRVVAFANEEQGLIGAYHYAEAHKNELDKHIMASESDFGAGSVWSWVTNIAEPVPAWMDVARAVMMDLQIPYNGNHANGGGPDIIPLFNAGVPVFRLNQDGRDYFDLHHTADDTFDKIDPQAFQQNVAAWATMLYFFAQQPKVESDHK